MEKYMVSLERFYGPLDLLLYLVEKDEMDIYDISISSITDQYMAYIQQAEEVDVEKMTAFLQMATFLLQLKSQMMLPKERNVWEETADTEPDPQAELINRIILYKQFKLVAGMLDQRQQDLVEQAFFRPVSSLPEPPQAVFKGETGSLQKAMQKMKLRRRLYQTLTLPFQDIRIEDKMQEIWERLQHSTRPLRFLEAAAPTKERREITAAFLAVLELMHQQKITVMQRGMFQEILIRISAKNKHTEGSNAHADE